MTNHTAETRPVQISRPGIFNHRCDYRLNHLRCPTRFALGTIAAILAACYFTLTLHMIFQVLRFRYMRRAPNKNRVAEIARISWVFALCGALLGSGLFLVAIGDLASTTSETLVEAAVIVIATGNGVLYGGVAMFFADHIVEYVWHFNDDLEARRWRSRARQWTVAGTVTQFITGVAYMTVFQNPNMQFEFVWAWTAMSGLQVVTPAILSAIAMLLKASAQRTRDKSARSESERSENSLITKISATHVWREYRLHKTSLFFSVLMLAFALYLWTSPLIVLYTPNKSFLNCLLMWCEWGIIVAAIHGAMGLTWARTKWEMIDDEENQKESNQLKTSTFVGTSQGVPIGTPYIDGASMMSSTKIGRFRNDVKRHSQIVPEFPTHADRCSRRILSVRKVSARPVSCPRIEHGMSFTDTAGGDYSHLSFTLGQPYAFRSYNSPYASRIGDSTNADLSASIGSAVLNIAGPANANSGRSNHAYFRDPGIQKPHVQTPIQEEDETRSHSRRDQTTAPAIRGDQDPGSRQATGSEAFRKTSQDNSQTLGPIPVPPARRFSAVEPRSVTPRSEEASQPPQQASVLSGFGIPAISSIFQAAKALPFLPGPNQTKKESPGRRTPPKAPQRLFLSSNASTVVPNTDASPPALSEAASDKDVVSSCPKPDSRPQGFVMPALSSVFQAARAFSFTPFKADPAPPVTPKLPGASHHTPSDG